MAYSYVQYTGDGSTTAFTFSFTGQDQGYLRDSDIEVTVDEVSASFTFLSSNSIELDTAPANGSTIIIRRVMPKSETYADFQRGNNFGQEVLNNSFLQLLYVVHELLDGWFPGGFTVREAVTFLEGLRSESPDPNDPLSVVTFGSGDERYVNLTGDEMQGSLNMDSYPVFVRIAVNGNEPARKDELDSQRAYLESSIYSVVSGYRQEDAKIRDSIAALESVRDGDLNTLGGVIVPSSTGSDTLTNTLDSRVPQVRTVAGNVVAENTTISSGEYRSNLSVVFVPDAVEVIVEDGAVWRVG